MRPVQSSTPKPTRTVSASLQTSKFSASPFAPSMRLCRQISVDHCWRVLGSSLSSLSHHEGPSIRSLSVIRTPVDYHSSFTVACARGYQSVGKTEDPDPAERIKDKPMYGYAKRLEFKNQMKKDASFEDQLRPQIFRRTLSPEESILAMDLVRKHKAMGRDAQKMRRLKKSVPQKAQQLSKFKPLPFSHCEPTTDRVVQSIVGQLAKIDDGDDGGHGGYYDEGEFFEEARDDDDRFPNKLIRIPEEEKETVGSLEGLRLRCGTPRPMKVSYYVSAFDLPLSRPDTQAFHRVRPEGLDFLDSMFAEWFIGMTEAQNPFRMTPEGRPYFAFEHYDMQLFKILREQLLFGHADRLKGMWYVIDDVNLQRVIHLLNGNLFLEKSRQDFSKWVKKYKALGLWKDKSFELKETCSWRPQLNNKWLMGFIDSCIGMFAGKMVEHDSFPFFRIHMKFWLLSQDESLLKLFQEMFDGGEIEKDGDYLRWTIKERRHHVKLDKYCRIFRTRSIKNVNLVRYNRLVSYPIVRVKSQKAWFKVRNLIENLNNSERKWALSLSFHPYHDRYQENAQTQMQMAQRGASKKQLNAYRSKKERLDFLWGTQRRLAYVKETN